MSEIEAELIPNSVADQRFQLCTLDIVAQTETIYGFYCYYESVYILSTS